MKCEYPNCEAESEFSLGMADPDAEHNFYCGGHIDIRKRQIMIELFSRDMKCNATCVDGSPCFNSKKFGNYCGIHAKVKTTSGDIAKIKNVY